MTRTVQNSTVLALLVEANGLVRLKLTSALEQEKYEVLWAATVEEAVQVCAQHHIDLLLLDLKQPLNQGWAAFERLRALNPALPVVILTERKTEFEQAVAGRVGALLEKPFSVASLIHTMNVLLGRPAQPHLPRRDSSEPCANHAT